MLWISYCMNEKAVAWLLLIIKVLNFTNFGWWLLLCAGDVIYSQVLGFLVMSTVYIGSPITFKHMIALTDEVQIVLSFPRTIQFNAAMYLNLIREPNVLDTLFS